MNGRHGCALVALAGLISACGPEASSGVKLNGQAVNVVFGGKATPASAPLPAPAPGANPTPHFPSIVEPPVPPVGVNPALPTLPPVVSATPCPTEALPGIKYVAAPRASARPAPASYDYVLAGSVHYTLPEGPERRLDGHTLRTVGNVRPGDPTTAGGNSFLFDVTETTGTSTLVTTYLSSPDGGRAGTFDPGLYLFKQVTTGADGSDVFAPTDPLKLLPFPALEATTWRSVATDPRSQVTFDVSGSVYGKKRLNFCGTGVEVWEVTMTGHIAGPGRVVNITKLVYDIGTQYGGLILHDQLDLQGYDPDGQYESTQSSTILREPDAAN